MEPESALLLCVEIKKKNGYGRPDSNQTILRIQ